MCANNVAKKRERAWSESCLACPPGSYYSLLLQQQQQQLSIDERTPQPVETITSKSHSSWSGFWRAVKDESESVVCELVNFYCTAGYSLRGGLCVCVRVFKAMRFSAMPAERSVMMWNEFSGLATCTLFFFWLLCFCQRENVSIAAASQIISSAAILGIRVHGNALRWLE